VTNGISTDPAKATGSHIASKKRRMTEKQCVLTPKGSTSQIAHFETEVLTQPQNLSALMALPGGSASLHGNVGSCGAGIPHPTAPTRGRSVPG